MRSIEPNARNHRVKQATGSALEIDLQKIESNARVIASLGRDHGIAVTGVTKATSGMSQVARAMLDGGITSIGDSRLENIRRLRAGGVSAPVILLRAPAPSLVDEVVTLSDISLNSEFVVVRALSAAAERHGVVHDIILMVDLGDLREGVWPKDLEALAAQTIKLRGVRVVGIGTNLSCYSGVIPTEKNLGKLIDCASALERRFKLNLRYISGGNSSSLPLLASGRMPSEINHLRVGEAILLGRETVTRSAFPGTCQDAFLLRSELIEVKSKPSVPVGEIGENAFGERSVFEDKGIRRRGIVNLGRADIDVGGISPIDPDITVLGASSDHLLLDLTNVDKPLSPGNTVAFQMNYSALVGSMASEAIEKIPLYASRVP